MKQVLGQYNIPMGWFFLAGTISSYTRMDPDPADPDPDLKQVN